LNERWQPLPILIKPVEDGLFSGMPEWRIA